MKYKYEGVKTKVILMLKFFLKDVTKTKVFFCFKKLTFLVVKKNFVKIYQ